jgi:hypothetical protein
MSEPWRLLPEGRDVEVLLVLLADPVGSLEVGEHKEVKEFGASGRREGLETSCPEVPPSFISSKVTGVSHRITAPTASARPITIAVAARAKRTFRQFGSIGGGRGVMTGSSNQSNGIMPEE